MLLFYTTNLNFFLFDTCALIKPFGLKYDHIAHRNIFFETFKLGQSYLILYLYLIYGLCKQ